MTAKIIDLSEERKRRLFLKNLEDKLHEAWDTMHITKIAFFVQELEKVETPEEYAEVLEKFGFKLDD